MPAPFHSSQRWLPLTCLCSPFALSPQERVPLHSHVQALQAHSSSCRQELAESVLPPSLWVTDTTQTRAAPAARAGSAPRLGSQGRGKEAFPSPHGAAALLPEQLFAPKGAHPACVRGATRPARGAQPSPLSLSHTSSLTLPGQSTRPCRPLCSILKLCIRAT